MVVKSDKIVNLKDDMESSNYPRLGGSFFTNSYRWLRDPYLLLDTAYAENGLTFEARLPVVGKVLISGDPDLIQETIRNRHLVGGRGTRALRPILGDDSLIILEGKAHTARKLLLTASLQPKTLQQYDQLTIESCLREIEQLPRHSAFSAFEVVRKVTLRSIILLLFGRLQQDKQNQISELINDYMNAFRNPLFLFVKPLQQDWGGLSPWGRLLRRRTNLRQFIDTEIDGHRQGHRQSDCLLGRMVEVASNSSKNISDESIFNELLGLLLFGHDTSAVTMAWLFYHVYSQQLVLETIQNEIAGTEHVNNYLGTMQPSYLRSCIMESMRLCPVVVHLTRVATCETQLGLQMLQTGDKVLPSAYLAQRNPQVFPEPGKFNPARFLNDEDYGYSFFPLGFGARKCIGEHLALRQMQIILYCFVSQTNLELDFGYRARPKRKMLLIGPHSGTLLRVQDS